jgi:hypothetical protein
MANTIYNITRTADGVADTEIFNTRVFKGSTTITFLFDFPAASHQVVKLKFTADGAAPQIFQGSNIPASIQHTFQPATYTYIKQSYATVAIYYNNFETVDYLIPIKIAQPSYFTDFENLYVADAQFLDTTAAGDMFVTLATNNNLHYVSLLANESAQISTSSLTTSILVATSAGTTTEPPIATLSGDLIEVATN